MKAKAAAFLLFFSLICGGILGSNAGLEVVRDEELMDLIKSDKYVVVLFSKKDCPSCDELENEVNSIREELVDSLNSWVVKAVDSQLTRLYSPTKEPALVFFRHGIPLLYDGQVNDELILHTLVSNKEPAVKELTDETFEHLTQAASGATTGDWFVMFYTPDCIDCNRLGARWEAVGARLKAKMNTARVNKATAGAVTARRFGVSKVPSFVLFRRGKMYRYELQKYDVASFASFAYDWYKNMKPEIVPVPKSPFDDFVEMVVIYLKENQWLWQIFFGTAIVGFLAFLYIGRKKQQVQKEKAQKKKAAKEK